jgi:class 3 adenylate cyclase
MTARRALARLTGEYGTKRTTGARMADPQSPAAKKELDAQQRRERRRRFSIALTLTFSFGSLLAVSILVVLALAVTSAARNTIELLQDKADLAIGAIAHEVDRHMQAAYNQASFLASMIEKGRVKLDDRDELGRLLVGAMAASPSIGAVTFFDTNGQAIGANRQVAPARVSYGDYSTDPAVARALAAGRAGKPVWGPPIYRPLVRRTMINLVWPIRKDGRFQGVLVTVISVDALSRYLRSQAQGGSIFVLYGKDRVLAHPAMAAARGGLTEKEPLPRLTGFSDRVLARMWDSSVLEKAEISPRPPLQNHLINLGEVYYVFIYRKLTGYTATPWYVGAYFRGDTIGKQLDRLRDSLAAGLAALALAIIVAFFIGRRLSKPIARLSSSARLVSEMKLDDIGILPNSRVRELDDQSNTFNSMVGALRWFQAYVPKPLVQQLIREGDLAALESDKRNLTVMFTDIVGYSAISEDKSAAEIADLLNQHFTIVAHAIEAEGGTVDKFIGDSVMAFWGAPEKQKNRAIRACRAALAIRDGIAADNRARAARGEPPVRMRIGIHSGEATVGNIGPPDRVNYTVIGDDVNVAQRLEQLGKEVDPAAEVAIVISAATRADLEGRFETAPAGDLAVKGREAPVEVHRLLGGPRP